MVATASSLRVEDSLSPGDIRVQPLAHHCLPLRLWGCRLGGRARWAGRGLVHRNNSANRKPATRGSIHSFRFLRAEPIGKARERPPLGAPQADCSRGISRAALPLSIAVTSVAESPSLARLLYWSSGK